MVVMNPILLAILGYLTPVPRDPLVLWPILAAVQVEMTYRLRGRFPTPALARRFDSLNLANAEAARASLPELEAVVNGTPTDTGTHDLMQAVVAALGLHDGTGSEAPAPWIATAAIKAGCEARLFIVVVGLMQYAATVAAQKEAPPVVADLLEEKIRARLGEDGGLTDLLAKVHSGLVTEIEKSVSAHEGRRVQRVPVLAGRGAGAVEELDAIAASLTSFPDRAALLSHFARAVEAGNDLDLAARHLRACARCGWVRDAIGQTLRGK